MSNNKNTYIVLHGGKECKLVNPNQQFLSLFKGDFNFNKLNHEWVQFEATNPTYALTEVMPDGVEFEGSEVWQYKSHAKINNWICCEEAFYNATKEAWNTETRLAIKPLKAIEPVKALKNLKN